MDNHYGQEKEERVRTVETGSKGKQTCNTPTEEVRSTVQTKTEWSGNTNVFIFEEGER